MCVSGATCERLHGFILGMTTVFIATGNAHKVEEIRAVLGSPERIFLSQCDAPVRL